MKVKSKVKAGGLELNHNETIRGIKVVSDLKAGMQDFHRRPGRPR